jgi:hypothetical protein
MMSAAPVDKAPLIFGHPLVTLKKGDITSTFCAVHMERTDHLYTGYSLVCLECRKDLDPRKEPQL